MTNPIYVKTNERITHSEREDRKHGNWKVEKQSEVLDVVLDRYLNAHSGVEMFECDAQVGDTVYVVSVTYTTGDSFGNSKGNLAVAGVYNNTKDAIAVRTKIEEQPRKSGLNVTLSDGTVQKIYGPWMGYFERVEVVDIESFIVKQSGEKLFH